MPSPYVSGDHAVLTREDMNPVLRGYSPDGMGTLRPRVITMRTKSEEGMESQDSNPAPLSRELVQEVAEAPPGGVYPPPGVTLQTVSVHNPL